MCKEKFINPFTEEERLAYEQSLKAYRDYNNTIQTAEWVGEEKGLAKGLAKGRAEGKRDMIRRMLAANMDIDSIASISGLSVDEIKEL